MAERRMFAKTIVTSDEFLDMPSSTRCLYFTLGMFADDDGFVNNPKSIIRQIGASNDDMNILIAKKFVIVFEDGVVVIKHWRIHNYIQKDRYKETKYLEHKETLFLDENNAYTQSIESAKYKLNGQCIQDVSKVYPQDRIELEIELSKDNKEKVKKEKFTPPTYEDVLEYAKSRNREDLAKKFYDYFTAGNWVDSKGNKVKNWKQKFITWEQHNTTTSTIPQQPTNIREWWTTENEKHKWIGQWWIDGKTDEELIKRKKRFDEGGINNALYDFSKL